MISADYYAIGTHSQNREDFMVPILTSDLFMVQSKETGRYYATTKKCSVSSTFNEIMAKQMIGKQLPGSIVRQACESYYYVLETGEVIELAHHWFYNTD